MRIQCLTTFLDGADRFEQGDVRTVPDERGAYFVAQGWASDLSGEVVTGPITTGPTDLAVDSSTVTMGDSNG